MSKSVKRNNKYFGYDDDRYDGHQEDHSQKLVEKRLRSVLRSRNKNAIFDLFEEDY